jgi:uncharacterized protein YceH (UPF0502 family)
MSNPLVHAFFVGRAVAQTLYDQLESNLTHALSDLGRFDAEQRERLRQFTDQVIERAAREEEAAMQGRTTPAGARSGAASADLQATLDELRSEIAQLRFELQQYRSRSV